jgi:Family of unknown function (DUF6152)
MKVSLSFVCACVAAALLAGAPAAYAHHSFAAVFDLNAPIVTMQATVVKYEFLNPHSRVEFDTVNDKGETERWTAQIGNTNALARLGWNKTVLNTGDKIKVDGIKARDGSKYLLGRGFYLPDGRKLFGNTANATR